MLVNDFPDNPVFQRWWGRIAAKRGDYFSASNIFRDVMLKAEKKYPGYNTRSVKREAVYYIGLEYKNSNELDSAKTFFIQCVEHSRAIDKKEESGFMINAILYLGMINDLQGNRDKAVDYYNQLLEMREYGRSHSLAKLYLDQPYKD